MSTDTDEVERNKTLVRRMFEEILPDPHASAVFDEVIAPDFVDHDPPDSARPHGPDSLRATHAYLHARFAGKLRFTIEELIGERDLVAVRWAAGPLRAMAWFRVRDGKLAARWAILRPPPAA